MQNDYDSRNSEGNQTTRSLTRRPHPEGKENSGRLRATTMEGRAEGGTIIIEQKKMKRRNRILAKVEKKLRGRTVKGRLLISNSRGGGGGGNECDEGATGERYI